MFYNIKHVFSIIKYCQFLQGVGLESTKLKEQLHYNICSTVWLPFTSTPKRSWAYDQGSNLTFAFHGYLSIFSRQVSLTRQAFLITPLHGARYKTGKNAHNAKK